MEEFDLRALAEAQYRFFAVSRYGLLGSAVFAGIVAAATVPLAFSHLQYLWVPIWLGGTSCVLGWFTSAVLARYPVSLEIEGHRARLVYDSGTSREIRWSDHTTMAYLRDARQAGKVLRRALPIEACLETHFLRVLAPLTGDAFDALLASARAAGAQIKVRKIPRWYPLVFQWGEDLGTVYAVRGAASR